MEPSITTRLIDRKLEAICATGLLCLIITCISTIIQINKHVFDNHHPQIRRYIIFILLMIIIYSLFAFSEFFQPPYIHITTIVRDLYESVAIYSFYQLFIHSLGGYHNLHKHLAHIQMDSFQSLWLCHYCCIRQDIQSTSAPTNTPTQNNVSFKWIKYITLGVLQFCGVQIVLTIVLFCLDVINDLHFDDFAHNIAYGWIALCRTISQIVAIYCLLLLYFILKSLPPHSQGYKQLVILRFIPKCLCIIGMVFATFWQRLLLLLLVYTDLITQRKAVSLQNLLICIEMALLSIAHWSAYKIDDFNAVNHAPMQSAWRIVFSQSPRIKTHLGSIQSGIELVEEEEKESQTPLGFIHEDLANIPTISRHDALRYYHSMLITLTNTFATLVTKILIAFIPFIMVQFGFSSFIFVTVSLSIGSLSTTCACLLAKWLLNLKSNLVYFILCIFECVGLFLLWFFGRNYSFTQTTNAAFFMISIVILIGVERLLWRCSESMIASFTTNPSTLFKIHASLNLSQAFAAMLLIPSGFFINYFDVDTYLAIVFPIFICLAISNLIVMPKKSLNRVNMTQSRDIEMIVASETTGNDVRILCNLRLYSCIVTAALFIFLGNAYFYVSFGPWITELFGWNPGQFGIFVGLMEGGGRLLSVLMVVYGVERGKFKQIDERENTHRLTQTSMMVWFSVMLMVSILFLCCGVIFKFLDEALLYCMVGLFFCGSQGVSIMILMIHVSHVPSLQQKRSLVILSVVQSIATFCAQCSIGPIYLFDDGLVLTLLVFIYFVILLIAIWINEVSNAIRLDPESRSLTGIRVPNYG
eukprot:421784_1